LKAQARERNTAALLGAAARGASNHFVDPL
jgi:hypothetical protein